MATARVERTITPQAWAKASHNSPVSPGEIDSSVDSAMSELDQPTIATSNRTTSYAPWIRYSEPCSGVIWASVPHMAEHWRDDEGGWIISVNYARAHPSMSYLRLSPAPAGETRVQYGFCPVRLNKIEELKRETWGRDELHISRMSIQINQKCGFRCDKMATSAVRLFEPSTSSPESEQFLGLLGRRSISVFIEDMLRGCYSDSTSGRDVLQGRDSRYRGMVELVAKHAYSSWTNPTNAEDLDRFRHVMGVASQDRWYPDCVWPYLYNVVMPRDIFEANSRNLEAGLPPIIPYYVTPKTWMFNGKWESPCTGLVFQRDCGVLGTGRKLVAGLMARSNLDIPGGVSIWPVKDNPPQEWKDEFVRCIEYVADLNMPLDTSDRIDLVLHESHCIPLVFRVHTNLSCPNESSYKFVRMVQNQFCPKTLELESVTVRECSPGGQEWIGEEVRVGANPSSATTISLSDDGTDTNSNTDEDVLECLDCEVELQVDNVYRCIECNEIFCRECVESCTGCGGWLCGESQICSNDVDVRCTECNDDYRRGRGEVD